ncbi:HDOD domain-containing protein [Dissulfurirhabdus thermomarina]|uniref:HDOD domain-containing protein n=1 Tax=Dissulfurirhabdus thermomarina TaxID=1765737 RepID=A0A6N9TPI5_DISTH|nr:HDOD domain-containing protein [Dissulfurirhabdus thermomarina]NDY42350.1 HDOD domain-containing protein [Dissulfurirhabdus thermomarina]NMX24214.1 HDOD domain-containing protein [Dissulfurirhabdus thermomarina]
MESPRTGLLEIDWKSEELPTLPAVAHRLMALASGEEASAAELTEILGQDPSLTLKILRAANSALFALSVEVTSVRQAVVFLGMDEVRRIALGSVLAERFLTVGPEMRPHAEALWRHSLAAAVLARELRGEADDPVLDRYTLALLHDMGWLVALAQAPEVYRGIAAEAGGADTAGETAWGVDHRLWGARLAETWGLPEPFQVVAFHHHAPLEDFDPPGYILDVALADHLALDLGFGPGVETPGPLPEGFLEVLGMPPDDFEALRERARDLAPRIEEHWRLFQA